MAMTETEKQSWRNTIDKMDRTEMARLRRFAPVGHPIFHTPNGLHEYFEEHFKILGGMSPAISKAIDWG